MADLPRIRVGGIGPDIAPDILERLVTACRSPSPLRNREAVREVGEALHGIGGFELMQMFFYAALGEGLDHERKAELEYAWDGVGEWRA